MKKTELTESQLDTRQVYRGRLLDVREDRVRLPNGAESGREYIVHPGAVVVVPVLADGRLVFVRQFRYPVGQVFLEFPAGKLDKGEGALACGQRELLEEAGFEAARWDYLLTLHPCIGYSNEAIAMYLARMAYKGHRRDEDEFLEIVELSLEEAMDAMRRGEVTDSKTMIGLFWAEKVLAGTWEPAGIS